MKSTAAIASILILLVAAALPARADQYSFKRTIDTSASAAGARTLDVTGINGNVHLYADSGSTVRVHAVLGARSEDALRMLDVRTSRDGSTLHVQDVCPQTRHLIFWNFADCNIELDVHYPRGLAVTLNSQNGNVAVDDSGAAVSIINSNGNIDVNGAAGAVSVKNSNGNVTIADARSNISASNKNGNVSATLAAAWRGTAIAMSTNAGNVELRVPAHFDAKVDARTRMGDVTNRANLRNGPVTVTATTTFGDVVISRE
jgi:putative adhesin